MEFHWPNGRVPSVVVLPRIPTPAGAAMSGLIAFAHYGIRTYSRLSSSLGSQTLISSANLGERRQRRGVVVGFQSFLEANTGGRGSHFQGEL